MDTPNKNMYHFVWNDDDNDQLVSHEQQLSPKDRVAKILRETELGDIPDLVFRGSKADSKKPRSKNSHQRLKTEEELFSIDDDGDDFGMDEFTFKGVKLDINDNANDGKEEIKRTTTKVHESTNKQYQIKSPAKVPPTVNKGHPRIPMKAVDHDNTVKQKDNHSETYIDSNVKSETTIGFSRGEQDNVYKDANTTALLPMDSKFLEMEFDDDVDSGVAIDQEHDNQQDQDTVPIVTVDQMELNERWRKRKQKINFAVALLILLVGVIVLIVAIVLIVKMIQA